MLTGWLPFARQRSLSLHQVVKHLSASAKGQWGSDDAHHPESRQIRVNISILQVGKLRCTLCRQRTEASHRPCPSEAPRIMEQKEKVPQKCLHSYFFLLSRHASNSFPFLLDKTLSKGGIRKEKKRARDS